MEGGWREGEGYGTPWGNDDDLLAPSAVVWFNEYSPFSDAVMAIKGTQLMKEHN